MLTIENLQLRIYDLYSQCLLSEDEAILFLKDLANISTHEELKKFKDQIDTHPANIVDRNSNEYEQFRTLKELSDFIEKSSDKINFNNWVEKYVEILNKIENFNGEEYGSNIIKGLLAKYLEKVYDICRKNKRRADDFSIDMEEIINNKEFRIPSFLTISKDIKAL